MAAIQEACDYAAKYGIFLALENHGGITATIDQMLTIVKAVKHDWFGVNLDTGNFHTADPYADLAKIAPVRRGGRRSRRRFTAQKKRRTPT